jgi:hypothetical protein
VDTLQDIKQAIDRLSPAERNSIVTWILDSRAPGGRVAEPSAAYKPAPKFVSSRSRTTSSWR